MPRIVTAAQMREAEAAAVAAGVSEAQLMENAGLAAAQEAWMNVGAIEGREILVLCGPGKNGGDGFVAARHLAEWGASVHVYLLRPRVDDDPQWRALVEAGIPATSVEQDEDFRGLEQLLTQAACVLDALLGTGAAHPDERPIEGDLAEILARLDFIRSSPMKPQLIALDLPSGVDADTGAADRFAVAADVTVTFGYTKLGLVLTPGRNFAGRVVPVDIGLPPDTGEGATYEEIRLRDVRALMPARPDDGHKGTFGTVVVVAGSPRYPGAARLAAEAGARSGAGLTGIAAPEAIQALLVPGLPDVIHEPLPSTEGHLDGDAARALLRALQAGRPAADALVVGPGLGLTNATREFMRSLVSALDGVEGLRGVVFDADALSALAEDPGWHERLALPRVLTPHPGEAARLAGTDAAEVQRSRLATALRLAEETRSVVVLKGAGSIVASPDGRARISPAGNAMLAHAGTGDVLAGLIGGMIAQGLDPFDAATAAVYVHGESGRLVREAYGSASGIAQDLLRAMPDARKLLEESA